MKILKSLIIWICFIPAAILNGGLREYVLAPAIGQKWALPVSGIILSVLVFLIIWLMFPRLIKNSTRKERWLSGIVWTLLTVIFEFATGLSGGSSIAELLAAYNPLTGNLWLLVLAATLFSPVITGHSYRIYSDLKLHKNDSRTYFLDKMQERLNWRMDMDDERERTRR